LSLWRNGDFLRLWSAQTISQFGSQVTVLALPLVAILVLDASAFQVAALTTVEWLPWLLFSLPAGVWVDRLPRRPVLVVTDLGRAAALVSIPIAYAFDALALGQLYVVGFVAGTLTVFFELGYTAYLPALVERSQLAEGNAKVEITRSAAQLGGPGLAGQLVQLFGAPVAMLVDAISFLGSALFVATIRVREEPRPREEDTRLRTELAEGIRFVLKHPYMRPSMGFVATVNLFYNIMFGVFLVYAVRSLDFDAARIGLMFTLGNVGVLAGALLATRIGRVIGVGPTIVGTAFMLGWPLLFVPLVDGSYAFPVLVGVFAVTGFNGVVTNVVGVSLFQATTPDRLQGRAAGARRLVHLGAVPVGSFAGGIMASTIGLHQTLWIGAIGATVAFLPLFFSPVRKLREVPDAPAESYV
jgi:predicted MFS family arabinose efflux permease